VALLAGAGVKLPIPTTDPLVKDRSSLVVRSSVLPAARICAVVFTTPVPCAIQVITSTVPAFVAMVMVTTLARKVPAGTPTDVVPPPWTVTFAVPPWPAARRSTEW
jgi:hypothetical protein